MTRSGSHGNLPGCRVTPSGWRPSHCCACSPLLRPVPSALPRQKCLISRIRAGQTPFPRIGRRSSGRSATNGSCAASTGRCPPARWVGSLGCRGASDGSSSVRLSRARRVAEVSKRIYATSPPAPRASRAGALPFPGEHLRDSGDLRRHPVADLRHDRAADRGADSGKGPTSVPPGPILGLCTGIVGRQRTCRSATGRRAGRHGTRRRTWHLVNLRRPPGKLPDGPRRRSARWDPPTRSPSPTGNWKCSTT